jgi:hypothetical protein
VNALKNELHSIYPTFFQSPEIKSFELVQHEMAHVSYRAIIVKLIHIESNDYVYVIDVGEKLLSKLDTKSVVFSSSTYVLQVIHTGNHILKHLEDKCRQDLENIEHKEFVLVSTLQDFHAKAAEATQASTVFPSSPFSATQSYSPPPDTPFQTPRSEVGGVGGDTSFDLGEGDTLSPSQQELQLMRKSVAENPNSLILLASSDSSPCLNLVRFALNGSDVIYSKANEVINKNLFTRVIEFECTRRDLINLYTSNDKYPVARAYAMINSLQLHIAKSEFDRLDNQRRALITYKSILFKYCSDNLVELIKEGLDKNRIPHSIAGIWGFVLEQSFVPIINNEKSRFFTNPNPNP